MNRQLCTAFATGAILLAVSAFALSATDFGTASEPVAVVAGDSLDTLTPIAAAVPGDIDLRDFQETAFRDDLQGLFAFIAQLYRDYPGQSFLFFRFLLHKSPF